jgi:hypothetical protein
VRVTWVHPSWRDLVIDHLSSDDDARVRFLRACSVHGALLALSTAGGESGQRRLPLLARDSDWDALTDRLYDLAPELEQAELVGVLDALRSTHGDVNEAPDSTEADALSRALLARLVAVWKASRAPIALPILEAWLAVGKRLSPQPPPPAIGVTWAELLPTGAPDFSNRASLERFADWLTLAELLLDYDPKLLEDLRSSDASRRHADAFLTALERDLRRVRTRDIDQAVRALARMSRLLRPLAERAYLVRAQLENREYADTEQTPQPLRTRDVGIPWRTGHLDVERVLKDL